MSRSTTEAAQIDRIAEKRGWFGPDPEEPTYPTIKAYMNGSLDLDTTVETLALPIEKQFSTADDGRAIRRAEKTATSQRKHCSPKEAERIWGFPLREDELPPECSSDTPTTEGLLWELWYGILHMARCTSWKDSAALNKLVDLVRGLEARPNPPFPPNLTKALKMDWIWSSGELWSDLILNGPATRECWNDSPRTDEVLCPAEIHAWTNINAFVATITKEGIANSYWLYAIWAMRDALEEEYKGRLEMANLDALVPAAAVWAIVLGERLWEREDVWESSKTGGDPASGGKKFKGKLDFSRKKWGFSRKRWTFWKKEFHVLSSQQGLRQETRDIATQAFERMKEVEKLQCN